MKEFFFKTFLEKKKKRQEINAFLGGKTEFNGILHFDGGVLIEGKFNGEIYSSGTLIIGEKGVVRAKIQADVILVRGETHGRMQAKNRVEAYSPAKIHGDIYSPVVVFGEGVTFQGHSFMIEDNDKKNI